MNAKTTRILKEARSLFWPWCAVIISGALPLVAHSHPAPLRDGPFWGIHSFIEPISFLGFFLGIPLLATLSLGNEFQHRTLPLLLSQPVGRMEIWSEKMSVMIVAVVSAALVICIGWRSAFQQDPDLWVVAGALTIPMIASATFWTLCARSTMGGLTLNAVNSLMPLAWHERPDWIPETITARSVAAFALLCYAGVMLWLGRRTLVRFEVTGGMAGEDLLVAGPGILPGALAGWFRSRPTGAVLNLIRKEFRLLRPLWLVTLFTVLGWICLTLFWLVPEHGPTRNITPLVAMVGAFTALIPILAGSLSLGEERAWGTHSWHLTLPVSAWRQWLIKLVIAMLSGVVCGVLLPTFVLLAGGFVHGSPLRFADPHGEILWLLTASLLSFASFWCACAVSGTVRAVRAVLWLFPVLGALLLAAGFGDWVGTGLMDRVASSFDLFTDFQFTNAVSNFQFSNIAATPSPLLTLVLLPTFLFAVILSYRLFRVQLEDNALSVIRSLSPLALVAFLCSFSLMAFHALVDHAKQQMWTMFRETHEAIEAIQPGTPNLDASHPLQLTEQDLAKAAPLSERTRRWLGNSRLTVAPDKPHPDPYCCPGHSGSITFTPDKPYSWYLATIQLPSGSQCTVSFQAGRGYGILGGVCK
jgi:ABC-type transport system involved in multi-copper enzyme maturation permease subunit